MDTARVNLCYRPLRIGWLPSKLVARRAAVDCPIGAVFESLLEAPKSHLDWNDLTRESGARNFESSRGDRSPLLHDGPGHVELLRGRRPIGPRREAPETGTVGKSQPMIRRIGSR